MKNKKGLSDKAKYIIAIILFVMAVLMIVAALVYARIKPPTENQGSASGSAEQSTPTLSENSDVLSPSGNNASVADTNKLENVFTVLAIGKDKVSGNTDTIMLATFDITNKKINILSIPRDTIVNAKRKIKKINGAFATAKIKSSGVTDEQAMEAVFDEVQSVTGIYPDHYVIVSLNGFVELIDAIGGVEVDVPINMHYEDPAQGLKIHINKGLQTLDGNDSMGFMRYRATYVDGDIGRINAQQTFVQALMKKMMRAETLVHVPEIAEIISENVTTDLTLGNMVWIGKEILTMDREKDLKMHTLPGYAEYYNGGSYYFPNETEVIALMNEYYNPYIAPITKLNLFKK